MPRREEFHREFTEIANRSDFWIMGIPDSLRAAAHTKKMIEGYDEK